VPLATPPLRPCGRPLPSAVGTSPAIDHSLSGNSQTWPARHAAVTRPTLPLLKELLCLCRGVSCSHRADKPVRAISADTNLDANLDLGIFMVAFMGRVHGPRSLHPVGTFGTNDTTDANRWVSHARVKRSDQSCRRRHSHDRFVQGCCLLRDRSHRRCTESDHRGMKSRSRLATSTSIVRSLSRCFVDFESDGLSRVAECCAHQAARHDVATTDQRRQWRCRDRDEHRRAPKIMRSAPAARARGGTAPTA
jgi:hypothetical protein